MSLVAPTPLGFERSPVSGTSLDDLDLAALHAFVRRRIAGLPAGDPPDAAVQTTLDRGAQRLGLVGTISSQQVPTVVGLMAFGTAPQLARPEWGVSCVRVRGANLADEVAARLDVEGPLAALVDQTLDFVRSNTRVAPNLLRPSEPASEYPEVAVREALLNALLHRDYRLSGRVSLRIFNDRLEVWSPGGLALPLSLDELAQHGGASFPRNPLLMATARSLGLVEQVGRGIPLIRKTLGDATSLPVQFSAAQTEVRVVLPSYINASMGNVAGN
ncbi:MAG TPA: ATP-binding protein [Nannocystis sp.]|jgi:ATP-dependent DNA helicase RecG